MRLPIHRLVACRLVIVVIALAAIAGCGEPQDSAYLPADMNRVKAIRGTLASGAAAASDEGAATMAGPEPTGWATLQGNFSVKGDVPKPAVLKVDKDVGVCAPGGKQVFGEELVVDGSGGLKNVVIYLTSKLPAEQPWTHPNAAPGNTDVVEFDQKGCIFLSHVLALQTSQTLKIMNSDSVGHNAKLDPKENSPFNQIIPGKQSIDYKFTSQEAAPFPVACSIHPWMNAAILVRDNGYFAVTADDGSFEISNLPAGIELEFRVWQEKSKFISDDVAVNGQATSWKKGRFTINLDPADAGKNTLDVTIDASVFK
jgi:plastocyanin